MNALFQVSDCAHKHVLSLSLSPSLSLSLLVLYMYWQVTWSRALIYEYMFKDLTVHVYSHTSWHTVFTPLKALQETLSVCHWFTVTKNTFLIYIYIIFFLCDYWCLDVFQSHNMNIYKKEVSQTCTARFSQQLATASYFFKVTKKSRFENTAGTTSSHFYLPVFT